MTIDDAPKVEEVHRSTPISSCFINIALRSWFTHIPPTCFAKLNVLRSLPRSYRTMSSGKPEWLGILEGQLKEYPQATSKSFVLAQRPS